MLDFNPQKNNCTGCSACYSVCPISCIIMKEDTEGFLYPEADADKCLHCGLCEKVCPMVTPIKTRQFQQQAVAALTKSTKIWRASASGGAFSEICNVWGNNDTLIVGAAWEGFSVHHLSVKGPDNIGPLRKSKYIASSVDNTFIETREYLNNGGRVVFSGTPCQIAGLRAFLRKDYDNLLTIDMICHGVGSPKVFKTCLAIMEKQVGKVLDGYMFRSKRRSYEEDHLSFLSFSDGSGEYVVRDPFSQLYLKQTCLRPSCGGSCAFRGKDLRQGDLTIADCKGLTKIFPRLLGTNRNYSTIVSNSAKGDSVLTLLNRRMKLYSYSIEDVIKYNPLFDRQTWVSKDRDAFFSEYAKDGDGAIMKRTEPFVISRLGWKGCVYGWLPVFARRLVKRLIGAD